VRCAHQTQLSSSERRSTCADIAAQVASDDDDDDDDPAAAAAAGQMLDTDMDLGQDTDGLSVKVNSIDAYWLQRQIAEAFSKTDEPLDAAVAQEKERAVLRLLESRKETAELEGDLVYHLDFKRFDLIKVCCSSWRRASWGQLPLEVAHCSGAPLRKAGFL
jgi:pre-mRNA-splicing helicase BRR2